MRRWWRGLRYRTCTICLEEFRRQKVKMPSLVGYLFCSAECEAKMWKFWSMALRTNKLDDDG